MPLRKALGSLSTNANLPAPVPSAKASTHVPAAKAKASATVAVRQDGAPNKGNARAPGSQSAHQVNQSMAVPAPVTPITAPPPVPGPTPATNAEIVSANTTATTPAHFTALTNSQTQWFPSRSTEPTLDDESGRRDRATIDGS